MMTTDEIRQKFFDFFASKEHKIIASDSLVPKDDPTVLFTTAGMQQFKRQFLGHVDDFRRAVTAQKCLRTDDLDHVGVTDCHHTFFEMLGNFSFGDYFKREAILWAWEFLTRVVHISPDRLWVSVNKDDAEAEKIWLAEIGIAPKNIFHLGDKSNFWPSNARLNGPNGPCGPCSEIFYDYTPESSSVPADPDDEPGRFTEVWNLVFTQFDRKDGGKLDALPGKNIDTGMGLERLAAVLQGKKNNFEIDLFVPILRAIETRLAKQNPLPLRDKRVIADHLRAVVFGINDGVVPSNEGRGYVMKKLIISLSDIAIRAGHDQAPVIYQLVPSVFEAMGGAYPELASKIDDIAAMIKTMESGYIKLRGQRMPEFEGKLRELKNHKIAGEDLAARIGKLMFMFRDTYGLTLEAMRSAVRVEYGDGTVGDINAFFKASVGVFETAMKEQQDKSRAASKMTGNVFTNTGLKLNVKKTDFTGYNHDHTTGTIIKIVKDNQTTYAAGKGEVIQICLDKSPFYAESGGQVGDTGELTTKMGGRFLVQATQKIDDIFLHSGVIEEGIFRVNDQVLARLDVERRLAIMRHHTATHLLQAALRQVLGTHVKQQGSAVDAERLRFDFTHGKALTKAEISAVEKAVNDMVMSCETVTKEELSLAEAKASGALAFFAEKYGDTVRVVTIGNYSKEFCGGTHLDVTGQVGLFKIVSESAIAQGIRRIEAKAGSRAWEYVCALEEQIDETARVIKAARSEVISRVKALLTQNEQMAKERAAAKFESIRNTIGTLIETADLYAGAKVIAATFEDADINMLRKVVDAIRPQVKSFAVVLGGKAPGAGSLLAAFSDDLAQKGLNAQSLINDLAVLIAGSGGGRATMAQAGSKNPQNVSQAVAAGLAKLKGLLG
ncbi:MAG: alanine--tRNA ligase [Candidatus Omnitrophica bacterium]|nr:alanine--tRNA ligase [Candidatus Omnitrophota bacterium]